MCPACEQKTKEVKLAHRRSGEFVGVALIFHITISRTRRILGPFTLLIQVFPCSLCSKVAIRKRELKWFCIFSAIWRSIRSRMVPSGWLWLEGEKFKLGKIIFYTCIHPHKPVTFPGILKTILQGFWEEYTLDKISEKENLNYNFFLICVMNTTLF